MLRHRKPRTLRQSSPQTPADSDEFNSAELGPQWQWQTNPEPTWAFPSQALGCLRMVSVPSPTDVHAIWDTPAVLLQKAPGPTFTARTKLTASFTNPGDRAGIVVMGKDYGYLVLAKTSTGLLIREVFGSLKEGVPTEVPITEFATSAKTVYLEAAIANGRVSFAYSLDGENVKHLGQTFLAVSGIWIGAKIGIFSSVEAQRGALGYADFDWFRLDNKPP